MIRLPPSITLILGLFIGLGIGAITSYYIVVERLDAEIAHAEKETVIDGEKKAAIIRKDTETNIKQSQILKDKVKSGHENIVHPNKQRFTNDFTIRLQSKVSRAQSFTD